MVSLLSDVVDRGTAAAARQWGVTFPAGGKTGTTDEYKDAWFVGFTSSLVVGVWVGFDQPQSIGKDAFAARYALPIWADFVRRTVAQRPADAFSVPAGLRQVKLCSVSYLQPTEGCPTYTEYFKEDDSIPSRLCPIHRATLKQQVRRTFEGLFSRLGEGLKHIFRRSR
jgi:penicillin-binding protein 1A